jgi:acetylornithine/N-succinyldiaminopimelate aminotransferase
MNSKINTWSSVIASTYAQPEITLVAGQGTKVQDDSGKSYLDFISGIAVNALGHAHPAIVDAVSHQVSKLGHVSNLVSNPIAEELAAKLLEKLEMPNGRIFFCNSGAEANEAAFKYARAHKAKSKMVSLTGGFHGRTAAALSLTGQPEKREKFAPLISNIKFIEPNDHKLIKRTISKKVGGVWLEIIQGEAGVFPLDSEFIATIAKRSRDVNALLVVDEVQTGMGRTGSWFAFQKFSLAPDLVPLAKGLGGGLPIGALAISEEHRDLIGPGGHGTTFGGNPIAAAAALAVISVIENENLLQNVIAHSQLIRNELLDFEGVLNVRGDGLLLGVVLVADVSKEVERLATANGLLVNSVRPNVIRLAPPLNVTSSEVISALSILKDAIGKAVSGV